MRLRGTIIINYTNWRLAGLNVYVVKYIHAERFCSPLQSSQPICSYIQIESQLVFGRYIKRCLRLLCLGRRYCFARHEIVLKCLYRQTHEAIKLLIGTFLINNYTRSFTIYNPKHTYVLHCCALCAAPNRMLYIASIYINAQPIFIMISQFY